MKKTVLVVDDNEIERMLLKANLKEKYEILEAINGEEALTVLHENASLISAVVLDIIMPQMNGYDVLDKMRNVEAFKNIPVIIATNMEDEQSHAKAVSLGANGFIPKPFTYTLLLNTIENAIQLREASNTVISLQHDRLTGLLSRESFFTEAKKLVDTHESGYYVLSCFDVENFKVINDQYGVEKGDEVLCHIADCINSIVNEIGGITCRFSADRFAILYPSELMNSDLIEKNHQQTTIPSCINRTIKIRIGRYIVNDLTISVSAMYDRATLAQESIKGRYDTYIATYDDSMRNHLLNEQSIINDMDRALAAGEFEPFFQPQYNHATGALIGAEALVRWRKDGKYISPEEFIPVFERNGFIYEMDRNVWEQVCRLMRKWIDAGCIPLPVSVNISRRDVFHKHFVEAVKGIVDKYSLPYELIRLEVTESAFAESGNQVVEKVGELIKLGFTVEIDDFGSGYSSLNTLKDVPADILKLDMRFFENTENKQRSGNIVESIVRMAKWLDMSVIAEGVEEKEQADYLKTIGCYYIQGFYYSKPLPVAEYEKLLDKEKHEPNLKRLETLKTLDNNEFWNPKSMETLIFNSYVGGACIFEYNDDKLELLRVNDEYMRALGELAVDGAELKDCSIIKFLSDKDKDRLLAFVKNARNKNEESSCDGCLTYNGCKEYVRATIRQIAHTGERYLFYGVIVNITEQRRVEQEVISASERIAAVMNSSHCGITAVAIHDNNYAEFIFVNNRFYEMHGYTEEQFKNEIKNPYERIHPDDRDRVVAELMREKKLGQSITLEMRAIRRDGKLIWVRCDISIVKFADVEGLVQLSNFLDITEQVESERKQHESAQKLQIVMSNINGGVSAIVIDDDGSSHMVFNNDKYFALYGYTREQAEAIRLDIMSVIHPEDIPMIMKKINKLKIDREPTIIDYRITKPDGSQALLRSNSSIMSMEGYGDNVLTSVLVDITEKKSLEGQLEAIISNINGGISATYLSGDELEFVIVNDRYYDIIGYTKEQFEKENPSVFDLILPDEREEIREKFVAAAEHQRQYTMEYSIKCLDGQVKRILCNTSIIHLFGINEPIQLAVSNDITELREAQHKEKMLMLQIQTIMANINGGVTATVYRDNNSVDLIYSNDGFYELYGYTRETAAAEIPDIHDIIVEEDKAKTMETVARIVRERGSETYEYRCRKRDGSIMWTHCSNTVISIDGMGDTILLAITTDITFEKEASEQFRFLNDSAHDMLAQPNSDAAINKTLERLLTYFAGDRAYVIETDNENRVTNNTYEKCADGVESEIELLQNVPFEVSDYWFDILNRNEFVLIDNVRELGDDKAELRELLLQQGIHSLIVAPLMRDGELVGFTGIDNPTKATNQLERLKAISAYITILLTHRDLNRKIEHDSESIKRLVNDTPGGFMRIEIHPDHNPTIDTMNDGFGKMVGMTYDEVMLTYGKDAYKCLDSEDIASIISDSAEAYASCGQFTSKCRLNCKNGQLLWVMVFGRFTKSETGKIYLNLYFTDISEQINADEQQKKLLDNLPCGAGLYEFDGKQMHVVHVNKRYKEMVGRDINSEDKPSVLDVIHPDDIERIRNLVHYKRDSNSEDEPCDVRIRHEDGTYHPYRINSRLLMREHGKWSSCVTFLPIPEEKLSMQQMMPYIFPEMMKSSTDITFAKDSGFRYLCCSHAYAKLLGLDSETDVVGKTDYELFSKEIADLIRRDDEQLFNTDTPIIDKLETLPGKLGVPYYTRISKYKLHDSMGSILGIYGIGRDITERRETSDQLNLITNSLPGGLATFVCTPDGNRLEYFNDGFCLLFGYTRNEFKISMDGFISFVFEEDRHLVSEKMKELVVNEIPMDCIYRIHTIDGGYKWINHKAVIAEHIKDTEIINAFFMDVTKSQEEKEQLRISEELNRIAIEHSGSIITRFDVKTRTLTLPDTLPEIYDLPNILHNMPEEQIALGRVSEDTAEIYRDMFENIICGDASGLAIYKRQSSEGWRWLEARFTTVFTDLGEAASAVISFNDVTEKLEKEIVYNKWQQSLNERPEESYSLFRCNLSKSASFDSWEGKLLHVIFDEAKNTFDERTAEYVEQCVFRGDCERYLAFVNSNTMLAEFYRGHRSDVLEYREENADGEIRWLRLTVNLVEYPGSKDVEAYLMYENIDEKKKTEILTIERSETDPLTGVLNRVAFVEKMGQVMSASRAGDKHALLMLDIDNFKSVNDTFGHAAGDALLIKLTEQIGSSLRHYDLLGRLGGDEFVILMKDIPNKQAAEGKAKRICEQLIGVDGTEMVITVSIGVAMIPDCGRDFETLYKKADHALYKQKANGKNGYTCAE